MARFRAFWGLGCPKRYPRKRANLRIVGTFRWIADSRPFANPRLWHATWLLIRIAALIILLHLIEIALWALLFAWGGAMPDVQAAFYFSSVTYTTTGYGDLVLPENWRLLGGVEALTGILMCGWSTGFFFAVVNRMLEAGLARRAAEAAQERR